MPFVREFYKEEAPIIKVFSHFAPWLPVDRSKSVCSNQKLGCFTQVTNFGLALDERARNNNFYYSKWALEHTDLELLGAF